MGRKPCCDKLGLKKGKWSKEEDEKLINYIKANGNGSWRSLPKNAGLLRCGKSCRLRWINYLREDLKRGNFTHSEEETIVRLHKTLGNRWSVIASHLPGRTDNEIKNYWNSQLSRRIYSFRSIGVSSLKTDTIKIVNTSKKRSGRVRRAVAKKYNNNNNNSNANSHSTPSRTMMNRDNISTIIVHEQAMETEGINDSDPLKTTSVYGSFSSSVDPLCMEVEGKEFDDIFMLFKNILEGEGLEDELENSVINYGNNEVIMNAESDTASEKRDCGDWNVNMENENVYTYSSPKASSFNDENFHWDLDGYFEEHINLWTQEEEDMVIWPLHSEETTSS